MPLGLQRFQDLGHHHFLTFSCFHRLPHLTTPDARDTFLHSLEQTRKHYRLDIFGYVVMPEHVHLLLSEPATEPLSKAIQALKLSTSKRLTARPFWRTRYYDFNVFTRTKSIEKLNYMHQNPVTRGLVRDPAHWPHSTHRHHHHNEPTPVQITPLPRRPKTTSAQSHRA